MDDLIARLEAASEGSRELDGDIAEALALHPPDAPRMWGVVGNASFAIDGGRSWDAPRYTASLDAALTLIQNGLFISLHRHSDGWYCIVRPHSQSAVEFQGCQKPAALALCIAALKARQAQP